jgi:undecaprenyl-diphosphatase
MFEYIILGAVQGIAEWLPVSSEGMIALVKITFFPSSAALFDIVKEALFLHLGTALAAIVYFRKELISLTKDLFAYRTATQANKHTIIFLIVATAISGALGLTLLSLVPETPLTESTGKLFTLVVGLLLIITGYLQLYKKKDHSGERSAEDITTKDSVILGLSQGFAALPGLSRSGLTVAALLLLGYAKKESLRLSFLLSIPIVLAGNVLLNISDTTITLQSIAGLVSAFVFGLLTIDLLLRLAEKINFGYFVLFFAILTIIASII